MLENNITTLVALQQHHLFEDALVISLLFIVVVLFMIMVFYHRKLKHFNANLAKEVEKKTSELRELNDSLEFAVEEKIQELIKKDKILTIQSKQAVMGEMISMIAHQWRQPLSTITLQISNYQLEQLMRGSSKKRKIDITLEEISNTIIYLSNTIDDFQTYFRPDRVTNNISTREVIEKVLTLADARIKRNKIEIKTVCSSEQEIIIYLNEFVQVLLNILNNAIDALETTDDKMREIVIYGNLDDTNISISIQDNANGIKEENMKQLFDPYFSTKGKNGTGLGLYMSQMIIQKQFGGSIDVKSSQNGTTFTVTIPISLD
jgi:C4-dicarboxylate-specific signal transduction histidine kinase